MTRTNRMKQAITLLQLLGYSVWLMAKSIALYHLLRR